MPNSKLHCADLSRCSPSHQQPVAEPIRLAILAYPSAQKSAVYGLVDLLDTADRLYQQEYRSTARFSVEVMTDIAAALHAEKGQPGNYSAVILPPSLDGCATACGPQYSDGLIRLHQQGVVLCSVCAGAFMLASSGLLEGRPATTHWALVERFRSEYPGVKLDVDKLIIDDGDIITAGGLIWALIWLIVIWVPVPCWQLLAFCW
ncbi:MAG: DJ-1/PfpI family protein [Marinobacterium sp.]|nr:DJ-1/PfpI family protein [Marinobacterium sp.]